MKCINPVTLAGCTLYSLTVLNNQYVEQVYLLIDVVFLPVDLLHLLLNPLHLPVGNV